MEVLRAIALLAAGIGLGLSVWTVLPAPTFALLTLSVGAPEVSPWLVLFNLLAGLLVLTCLHQKPLRQMALGIALLGTLLAAWPLGQWQASRRQFEAAMMAGLGPNYQQRIPPDVRSRMRTTPFDLSESLTGLPSEPVRFEGRVPFATTPVLLRLNVYRPVAKGVYPTLVVIYGGSWQQGSPDSDAEFSRYMAARGWVVFAIDYRHAPAWHFPAQLEDVRAALAFIRKRAAQYGADPQRLVLMGRSAGAHLAMLAAYQADLPPVRGVVSYYGPIYLRDGYREPPRPDPIDVRRVLEAFIGGTPDILPERYRQASPISYVDRQLPPTLLVYGSRDNIVEAKYGRRLYGDLRATGTRAVLLELPWAGHAFDTVFAGLSNQVALYYTERFLAWAVR